MKIRILVYRPGLPGSVEEHDDSLEAQQALVGGYIESVALGDNVFMTCNEEGRLQGLQPNFTMLGNTIVGTVFFHRVENSECQSLTDTDIARIQRKVGRY